MLQFFRDRLKIEQNCRTLSLMLVNSDWHPTFLHPDLLLFILF